MALRFGTMLHNFATFNEQLSSPYDNNDTQAVLYDGYPSSLLLSLSLR